MNEQKQNLEHLRKSIHILKKDIASSQNTFITETERLNFGTFYNSKVAQIGIALIELKIVLGHLMSALSSKINRLEWEEENKK